MKTRPVVFGVFAESNFNISVSGKPLDGSKNITYVHIIYLWPIK